MLSACAYIYHEICLSRRETVRPNWKPWVSRRNRETWGVCWLKRFDHEAINTFFKKMFDSFNEW